MDVAVLCPTGQCPPPFGFSENRNNVWLMAPDKAVLQKVVDSLKSVGQFDLSEISVCETSAVYKAVEQKLRKALVIKLMPVSQWGEKRAAAEQMAANERKIVRGFDHPNLPRMLTGGEIDGHFFWICDFVEGIPLSKTIEKGETLKALDLVDMARQLCASLEYTSKSGIVHHRFTPSNLIVEWDGAVKLLDWGVPQYPDLGANASEKTLKAAYYLSPEQLAGQAGDYRSSLFSVGVILHQLATGKLPFSGGDIGALRMAMEGSVRTLVEHDRKIPPGISVPIMKLLAKDPAQRYKSGPEFIKELENYKKFGQKEELPANFVQKAANAGGNREGLAGAGGFGALETEWSPSDWKPAVSTAPRAETVSALDSAVAVESAPVEVPPVKETVYEEKVVVETPKPKVALPKVKVDPKKVGDAVMREMRKIPPLAAVIAVAALFFIFLAWRAVVPYLITDRMSAPAVDPDIPNVQSAQPAPYANNQSPSEQAVAAVEQQAVTPEPVTTSSPRVVPRKKVKQPKVPVVTAPAQPSLGELSVNSDPTGAQFQIDGQSNSQFVTPATVGQLGPGKHTLTFAKSGYRPESLVAEVVAGSRATAMVRLSHQGGIVMVGSTPSGGSIFVDGHDAGKVTPAQVTVSSGQHVVSVRTTGYLEYSSTVTVSDGQSQSVSGTLIPLGRTMEIKVKRGGLFGRRGDKDMGTVTLRSNPPGAAVSVNGQLAPKATPVEITLNPGGYELIFELRGYKSAKRGVVVNAGGKTAVDVNLEQ